MKEEKLTKEAEDEIAVEIFGRRKNDETWDSIAVTMDQKKSQLKTLYYSSTHPDVLEYKVKLKEKKESVCSGFAETECGGFSDAA